MMFPRMHRSGWNGPTMRAEYSEAVQALSEAIVALAHLAAPGRDYRPPNNFVPGGADVAAVAKSEHMSRLNRLITARAELEEIVADLDDQIAAGQAIDTSPLTGSKG